MKFDNCASCMLRDRPIVMEDYIDNDSDQTIMLIGEAPGYTETKTGKPFTGKSGSIIRNIIKQIKNYNIVITNSVLCHPDKNETPNDTVLTKCRPNIINQIQKYSPVKIITLGNRGLQQICKIYQLKHIKASQKGFIDTVLDRNTKQKIEIYATYHPAYYLRSREEDIINHILDTFKQATNNPNLVYIDTASKVEAAKQLEFLQSEYDSAKNLDLDIDLDGYDIISCFEYENYMLLCLYKPEAGKKIIGLPIQTFVHNFDAGKKFNFATFVTGDKKELRIVSRNYSKILSDYIKNINGKSSSFGVIEGSLVQNFALFLSVSRNRSFYIPSYIYLDIEVLNNEGEFPDPVIADRPIICYSYMDNNKNKIYSCYLQTKHVDLQTVKKYLPEQVSQEIELIAFENEKDLVAHITNKIKDEFALYVGWNVGFDVSYIINRYIKLTNDSSIIPCKVNDEKNVGTDCDLVYGATIDLLKMYRNIKPDLTSYSLDNVSKLELNSSKVKLNKSLKQIWDEDPSLVIAYNIYDTILVSMIDEKYKFVDQYHYLRSLYELPFNEKFVNSKVLATTVKLIAVALRHNLIPTMLASKTTDSYTGAYVREFIKGVFRVES